MTFQVFFGITATLLALGAAIVYIVDILRGSTRPHVYTQLVWFVATTVVFFGQIFAHSGPGAWATGASA